MSATDASVLASVLIVDDDPAVGKVLSALIRQEGLQARDVRSADAALTLLEAHPFDVVITDLRMPGMDGMALLEAASKRWPDLPIIMLTAHGTVSVAVEAMKRGAADFLTKPFDREQILYVVRKALAAARHASERVATGPPSDEFVGDSPAMAAVYALIRRAAPAVATVLIRGETGTGKDLAARAIHAQSPRADQPFVKVQCSGLPDALIESELFGYERGAFTGATMRKPGRVELAQKGTLFLDEIGDLTGAMQVKLLRVLQDRAFERLGGTQTIQADVRFVAATHRDLEARVRTGEFREDLYYRLNVIPIGIPPLRERRDDIPLLARHFCTTLGAANRTPGMRLSEPAIERLKAQTWPGNVRQLQNFIERLVVLSDGPAIGVSDVERELSRPFGPTAPEPTATPESGPSGAAHDRTLEQQRREAEREAVVTALQRCHDNRTRAARILGVSRRTLYNKLQELGLS
jgi:two-component system response regulator AtoC